MAPGSGIFLEKVSAEKPFEKDITVRVQVPNNHIRARSLFYESYCPKPKVRNDLVFGPWTLRVSVSLYKKRLFRAGPEDVVLLEVLVASAFGTRPV